MGEHREGQSAPNQKARRFRVTRRVKTRGTPARIETREERELRELAEMGEDADRGTPEHDRELRAGCMAMVRVVALFFVVMILSIIITWATR
ncbi:hypothetical protein J2Z79_002021 [Symbiobacterium terraclitae]|uniref:Uncharacterized protein n=1 Tax=Symbiobacterium terraclitae TaxID=557451 RepID=A0ABS4JUH2_9FIRM|nr:hypothetical protein [Symbiobacterium terraclitae]MBP2018606.1 hypothetical protein [Symbiobacterium terraclitae]